MVKIVTLFLIVMLILGVLGRLRMPKLPKLKRRPRDKGVTRATDAVKCPQCGTYMIGKGACPCGAQD